MSAEESVILMEGSNLTSADQNNWTIHVCPRCGWWKGSAWHENPKFDAMRCPDDDAQMEAVKVVRQEAAQNAAANFYAASTATSDGPDDLHAYHAAWSRLKSLWAS